jgi:hypothetical protein
VCILTSTLQHKKLKNYFGGNKMEIKKQNEICFNKKDFILGLLTGSLSTWIILTIIGSMMGF